MDRWQSSFVAQTPPVDKYKNYGFVRLRENRFSFLKLRLATLLTRETLRTEYILVFQLQFMATEVSGIEKCYFQNYQF